MPYSPDRSQIRSSSERPEASGTIEQKKPKAEAKEGGSELAQIEAEQKALIIELNEAKKKLRAMPDELRAQQSRFRQDGMGESFIRNVAESGAADLNRQQEHVNGLNKRIRDLEARRDEVKYGIKRTERPN